MFDDVSMSALRVAASGLAARQKAIAGNIANIETPGYLARKVQFESALNSAVSAGISPEQVQATEASSLEPTRLNGNNVNLDHESLAHIDTTMRYQLTMRALDGKYSALRDVIRGG